MKIVPYAIKGAFIVGALTTGAFFTGAHIIASNREKKR